MIENNPGASGFSRSHLVETANLPIDPQLAPLADNGGFTWTHALLPNSPAIAGADPSDRTPKTDQRGTQRNPIVDIGELGRNVLIQ